MVIGRNETEFCDCWQVWCLIDCWQVWNVSLIVGRYGHCIDCWLVTLVLLVITNSIWLVSFIINRYEVELCEIVWCIKHKSISAAFFDESAAQFFLPQCNEDKKQEKTIIKRWKYSEMSNTTGN